MAGNYFKTNLVGHHAVDGEGGPVLAEKVKVHQRRQPVVIVDHDRPVIRSPEALLARRAPFLPVPFEGEELGEDGGDAIDIGLDHGLVHHLAALILARRVADLGRPTAH